MIAVSEGHQCHPNLSKALAIKTSNGRFAKDSYRRFIQMYSNVVLGIQSHLFEELIENYKLIKGVLLDADLDENDWDRLIKDFKNLVKEKTKKELKSFKPRSRIYEKD